MTDSVNRDDEVRDMYAEDNPNGAQVLTDIADWFSRFIRVTDPDDLNLLSLWCAHTHMAAELYTTPRLQLDSTLPGSGKTTVLDHMSRLCCNPIQAATLTSPALIPRLLQQGPATILLDEVDRSLAPDRPGVGEMLGILNSGYRVGATRPVLVPVKGGGWEVEHMPTFAPVAMAGNAPNLPDDTRSRNLRILLMPDLDGTVEDSDWEHISADADRLHTAITRWADDARTLVRGLTVELPTGCIGRSREKWRPLKRVAVIAAGGWPEIADRLIAKSIAEDAAEREAGLKTLPPGMVLLSDLHKTWPTDADFMATRELVARLVAENPDYWGERSNYGKQLTEARFGRLLSQAAKLTSHRPERHGPRGFLRVHLEPVWHRLGIAPFQPGAGGAAGEPGSDSPETDDLRRVRQENQARRVQTDPPAGSTQAGDEQGMCLCGYPPPPGRSMHYDCERQHTAQDGALL